MVEASLLADRVEGGGEIVLDTIFNANPVPYLHHSYSSLVAWNPGWLRRGKHLVSNPFVTWRLT